MTPADVLITRLRLGLTQTQLAAALGRKGGARTIRKWEASERPVPASLERELRDLERELAARDDAPMAGEGS